MKSVFEVKSLKLSPIRPSILQQRPAIWTIDSQPNFPDKQSASIREISQIPQTLPYNSPGSSVTAAAAGVGLSLITETAPSAEEAFTLCALEKLFKRHLRPGGNPSWGPTGSKKHYHHAELGFFFWVVNGVWIWMVRERFWILRDFYSFQFSNSWV